MTAEVAIANSSAVALAADSAVTIGGQKIYNSALKVFSLSKLAPVGAMIYGNATLLGVPWETLVKEYRKQLGAKRFDALEQYATDLVAYLNKCTRYFPNAAQDSWLRANIRGFFGLQKRELEDWIKKRLDTGTTPTEAEMQNEFQRILAMAIAQLEKFPKVAKLPEGMDRLVERRFRRTIDEISKEVFQSLPLRKDHVRSLGKLTGLLHTRTIFSNGTSGLVVAGFGEDELYPSVVTYQVEGFILDRMKCQRSKEKCVQIQQGGNAAIIPFAQDDMVYTFMQGMNPVVEQFVRTYLNTLFARLPELLSDDSLAGDDSQKAAVRQRLRADANSLLKDFLEQFQAHTRQSHISPIIEMVAVLPKDELAAMAESLVNLTAFKRRMTRDLETVGGPIDVAVISKGDGLVWVKRKHYFPRELNQHFFENYFRGL
ncbi:MAG: hypothetical protein U1F09_09310 [Steroidobacteraceae bacterium]